ncbi:hypothetical protein COO60DRAFT_671380 [Scenedesmus sp. NREL 46B-D3]|nr:hypothetical protein COO60DRAFT_671380 [Scenedesmus sp. NREL 46B-D3]
MDDLARGSSSSGSLVPGSVSRQQLQQAYTLDQVDSKMVVVRCGSVLLAVDQHAADERVQLEALQEQLAVQLRQQREQAQQEHATQHSHQQQAGLAQQQDQLLLQRQRLVPGTALQLTMAESKALAQYKQQVEAWGWQVHLQDSTAAAAGSATAGCAGAGSVNSPALLQEVPLIAGVQLGAFDLQLYLHQLLETGGSANQPPPGVVRVVKSKACRSAVMFGTQLSRQQCVELVQRLGEAQLCFCCAHGRPTTVPLIDLAALQRRMQQQAQAHSLGLAAQQATTAVAAAPASSVDGKAAAMRGLAAKLCGLLKC